MSGLVGLAAVRRKLEPSALYGKTVEALFRDASAIALRDVQAATRGMGAIPSTFLAESTPMGARVHSSDVAAIVLETGRRAGAQMPPPDALQRYGGATFAIARAIAQRGIRGRFFMREARRQMENRELPRLVARAVRQIEADWGRHFVVTDETGDRA